MIRAKHSIRHNGKEYKKGAILDGLKPKEEKRLVSLKAAEYVLSPEEELKKQQVANDKVVISEEEFTELRDALEDEYNYDDLKRAAKEAGVDLTNATKKDDIIAAIINQGKADELLEDDEDGNAND
jgi:hypothetical protein